MTLAEARELLGVDGGADERTLRRAYLRAVKAHPPERDAEGFARVCEAREICQRHVSWTLTESSLPEVVPLATPQRPAEEQALLDGCWEPSLLPQEQLAAAEQVLEKMPDEPSAFWAKHAALVGLAREDEALAWLREGQAKGVEGCLTQIAFDQPQALDDSDVAALLALRPFPMGLAPLLARRSGDELAATLIEAMEAQEAGESRGFWIGAAAGVILELVAEDRLDAANSLYARLRVHQERIGERSGSETIGAKWLLTSELMELPPTLLPRVRPSFARAILALLDDPEHRAASAMVEIDGQIKGRAAKRLRKLAPNLHAIVTPIQFPKHLRVDPGTGHLLRAVATAICILAFNTIARGSCDGGSSRNRELVAGMQRLRQRGLPPISTYPHRVNSMERERSVAALSSVDDRVCPQAGDSFCYQVRSLLSALRQDDCAGVRLAYGYLGRWAPADWPDPVTMDDAATFDLALATACPPVSTVALDASAPMPQSEPPFSEHDEASP